MMKEMSLGLPAEDGEDPMSEQRNQDFGPETGKPSTALAKSEPAHRMEIYRAANAEPLSLVELKAKIELVQSVQREIMVEGVDYGIVPGCGPKPAILKPGIEKLDLLHNVRPCVVSEKVVNFEGHHREYSFVVGLKNISTGLIVCEGVGTACTLENKFRYLTASRTCPECGQTAIIKGKKEYGGGWLCYAKKGGCGKKWPDGAQVIEEQAVGQMENPNPADQWNNVRKRAYKRAHGDVTLWYSGGSHLFTVDIEEDGEIERPAKPPKTEKPRNQDFTKKDDKSGGGAESSAHEASTSSEQGPSTPPAGIPPCPKCGAEMVLREGKNGKFYGCPNYPDCKGTRNHEPAEDLWKTVGYEFDQARKKAGITGDREAPLRRIYAQCLGVATVESTKALGWKEVLMIQEAWKTLDFDMDTGEIMRQNAEESDDPLGDQLRDKT